MPEPEAPAVVLLHLPPALAPRATPLQEAHGQIEMETRRRIIAEQRLEDLQRETDAVALELDELGNGPGGDPIVRRLRDRLRAATRGSQA